MMKVTLGRQDSGGIRATYENARHHAKPAVKLIDAVEQVIVSYALVDFEWRQFNNCHLLISNGRTIVLRPYNDVLGTWGIEVGVQVKRGQEIPLFNILDLGDVVLLQKLLNRFLLKELNTYSARKD